MASGVAPGIAQGIARQPARIEEMWTAVNGLRIYGIRSTGSPDAPPLVLVPGLNVSTNHTRPLAELLAPYFPVYSLDLPGYGRSDKPWPYLNLRGLSDAVVAWMRVIGLGRAALYGSSWSAQIVSDIAVRYPAVAERVVLVGPTIDPSSRPFPKLFVLWRINERREPAFVGASTKRDYQEISKLKAAYTFWLMLRDHIERRLPSITVPALVVRGGNDPIVSPQWANRAMHLLPRGQLVVIPGAAHAVDLDATAALAAVMRPFLAGANDEHIERCTP